MHITDVFNLLVFTYSIADHVFCQILVFFAITVCLGLQIVLVCG